MPVEIALEDSPLSIDPPSAAFDTMSGSTQRPALLGKAVAQSPSKGQSGRPVMDGSTASVTMLLHRWKDGDAGALEELTPIVYQELLRIARRQLRAERNDHTLAPTALVHEAWMRMLNQNRADWRDRTHFYALASRFMRRILVDYSRNHRAQKRGGAVMKVSLDDGMEVGRQPDASVIALDDALTALAAFDERKAKVIELRFFGGLTIDEIAGHIGVSVATVGRELRMAQAWLHREMSRTGDSTAEGEGKTVPE